ncbi:glycosyltransferase family 2 protein [Coprobacter tertius]|uniref:Glycosyltransferase family 2 protein n=1 Tax=Coprobacter tertius TaxID=2944915 RepID=A0ABT1MJS1_9BACT|nr:glycosyltransferase family 2 protein [Coprobacter tertius]MCP9612614.1 glycosyltransferase family 2 protein [Coprobacter tertius]
MKKITILLPAFNEEESICLIENSMNRVTQQNPNYLWSFLLVNDGSTDNTLQEMVRLHTKDNRFSYLDLSRNYGKEIAMMAGFDYIDSDAVIIMDADMQHPIEIIPEMLSHWEKGYDDIYAYRKISKEKWFKRNSSKLYYRLLQKMTKLHVPKGAGDFRLLDRTCIEALKQMRETERNTKGMYSWIGFKKKGIPYVQGKRLNGSSKWGFIPLLNLAINGITSFTTVPLRIASVLGIAVSTVAFAYLSYIIFTTLVFGERLRGYPTIMVTILFLGGVQLISLGIIGEYLGKVFNESKRRPGYFINSFNGKSPKENNR